MAEELTLQQREAVVNRGGNLLVSAAAGSGKTKVLVDRLLRYLTDPTDPADLDEFLIITYTNAAATELRAKIASKLTERIAQEPGNRHLQKQMQRLFLTKISTVHGFCGDILREYAYKLDLSADFRIADENECMEIREQVMNDLLEEAYRNKDSDGDFRAFADTQGLGRTDRMVPEIIESVYNSARCHMDPDKWLEDCLPYSEPEDITDASETVWGRYLMEDLFDYLDCQIKVFRECLRRAECCDGYEKVCENLKNTLLQLEALRSSGTWDAIRENSNILYGTLRRPGKKAEQFLFDHIKPIREACKDGLAKKLRSFSDGSEQIIQDLKESAAGVRGLIALVRQFDRDYSAAKKRRRCLDFSDLEHKTLELLLGKNRTSPTAAAEEIGRRFREIMVDEYQDSNSVQDTIFSTLTARRDNCFMVGDVKQSIYQFRLADPGIFLEKYNCYAPYREAQPGQGRKVLLSHNFRSGPEIVEAVNDVFYACMRPKVGGLVYGEEEALREGVPRKPLPDPAVEFYAISTEEDTYPEEAAFVADRIDRMLKSGTLIRSKDQLRPVQPEDIVILLRSPGPSARYFQKALEARGIRYTSGGGTDLLKTQEIAVMRALLQTIQNPRLDIPLISCLASPLFGFSADLLARIRSNQKKGNFYDALLQDNSRETRRFLLILDTLRRDAGVRNLSELLEHCFSLTHADSIFGAMPSGAAKAANLQQFYQMAVAFEKGSVRDLSQFLDYLNSLEGRGITGSETSSAGCVTILSIHKSKGLEFPVVFLCNLSKKFNLQSLRSPILCDKTLGIGVSVADAEKRIRYPSVAKRAITVKMEAESLSEEMRVLYVALTRPQDRLIMTYASRDPAKKGQEIAMRMDYDRGELVCREANCMGEWVMMTVLGKTEAGDLHNVCDRPDETKLSEYPWIIQFAEPPEICEEDDSQTPEDRLQVPEELLQALRANLQYQYPHMEATTAPSKQTATGRKGRAKDEEAAQHTRSAQPYAKSWRKPAFAGDTTSSTAYGNAMHAAMQYICFEKCADLPSVQEEIQRLLETGILREEQVEKINAQHLLQFFRTPLGRKLRTGTPYIREFKFSVLDDGCHYGEGLDTEKVLLQGVVDCALIEEDGITVVDFKTDSVTEDTLKNAVVRYRPQVEAYAQALSRIYELPVKNAYLYFFRLNHFEEILCGTGK